MAASKPTTTSTTTGASAKVARQSKLAIVRDEQPTQQQQEPTVNTQPATPTQPIPATVVEPTIEPTIEQIIEQTSEQVSADLAALHAQRRALNEQIKAARAAQPAKEPKPAKPSKTLHDVIEQQEAGVGIGHVLYVASRAQARIKMGQDPAAAVDQVLAREGEAALGAITRMLSGDYPDLRSALMSWAEEHAPLTVVKQHTQVSDEGEAGDEQ